MSVMVVLGHFVPFFLLLLGVNTCNSNGIEINKI